MSLPLSYHCRHLLVRRSATVLTILVVAAVTAVFGWMLSFRKSLEGSLAVAGDPQKIIVLKAGATAESNSAIAVEDVGRLSQVAEAEIDPVSGQAVASPEAVVQVQLPRLRDGGATAANVAVRGVTANALKVHRNVRLLGPMFSEGGREVIVGLATARQFKGLRIGDTINLGYSGNRGFKVVGFFTADGGPMESEIWGYLPALMNAYNRTLYSSVSMRLRAGADPAAAIRQIEGPAIQLSAQTEYGYWQRQARLIRVYLATAGLLVAVMCVAAVFSIANSMFSAVAGRVREIAMLRTIGFGPRQILVGFLLESALLSLVGGVLGCLACALWLSASGGTKDMFGAETFTTLAFQIRLVPSVIATILLAIVCVGVLGAIVPAVRAARLGVVSALRQV
jgi:putative ABC transport system permease protein